MEDVFNLLSISLDKNKVLDKNKELNKNLAKKFNCSSDELKILSVMTNFYVSGKVDILVIDIFQNIYENEDKTSLKYLDKIKYIKNLIVLGWIVLNVDISNKKNTEDLELLQKEVKLSSDMLFVLQNGEKEPESLIKGNFYKDNISYLMDQFLLVDTYDKQDFKKKNNNEYELSLAKINKKISNTKKNKKIERFLEDFIGEYKLNKTERTIFFFVLKAEYLPITAPSNNLEAILSLISKDDKNYMENKKFLLEDSKLCSSNLLSVVKDLDFYGMSNLYEINEEVLEEIESYMYGNKKDIKQISIEQDIKEDGFFSIPKCDVSLEHIILEDELKQRILKILKRNDTKVLAKMKKWKIANSQEKGLKIIFYGPSGTGKTITAKALAKEMNQKLVTLDCSKILDMYYGESEKNVRKIFDKIEDIKERLGYRPILLLDEADQFLSSRSKYSSNLNNNIQNIFLQQIEEYQGIIIASTNFMDLIDKAFSRRFDYRLKFKRPNLKNRIKLWKLKLPQIKLNIDIKELGKYDLSGGQIDLIIRNTCFEVALQEKSIFKTSDFKHFIDIEMQSSLSKKHIGFS